MCGVLSHFSHVRFCVTLWTGHPGKNAGVGCHALLQGIFASQGSNLCLLHLLHWQVGSSPLVPSGKPKPIACAMLKVNSCELWVIARHQ